MSQSLNRLIQIAVRSAAHLPQKEQTQILTDCLEVTSDQKLRANIMTLCGDIKCLNDHLRTFEVTPYEDQI
jgi:hypothetical protein